MTPDGLSLAARRAAEVMVKTLREEAERKVAAMLVDAGQPAAVKPTRQWCPGSSVRDAERDPDHPNRRICPVCWHSFAIGAMCEVRPHYARKVGIVARDPREVLAAMSDQVLLHLAHAREHVRGAVAARLNGQPDLLDHHLEDAAADIRWARKLRKEETGGRAEPDVVG